MTSVGKESGTNGAPDLSPLKEMVGVQKDLKGLVSRKQNLDKAAILGVLEAQRKVYAANGLFVKKEMALQAIIAGLEAGTVGVDAILQAAQVSLTPDKPAQSGFSFGKLFGKARSS